MKRIVAVLSSLLVLPAFAEVAPDVFYDDGVEYYDDGELQYGVDMDYVVDTESDIDNADTGAPVIKTATQKAANTRTSGRVVSSRTVPTAGGRITSGTPASSRAVAARGNNSQNTTARTTSRTTASRTTARPTASRSANASRTVASRSAASRSVATSRAATATQARGNTSAGVARAGFTQLTTTSAPLYNSNARVGIRGSGAVGNRMSTVRSGTYGMYSSVSTADTVSTTEMETLQELTDYCKASYAQCMDSFCNVLDDNQGRCSCSKNLQNYSKSEEALKTATEALQDVAQQIQYIGLTGDEVATLFTETEAEIALSDGKDTSDLKKDLDKIKDMIVAVKQNNATSTSSSGLSLDLSGLLDFSFSDTGFDLASLFGDNNTSSINNQRGEDLYKTATARCKATVLNGCTAQGVDASVITNSYDLEIDKQCIVYERALTESNDQMSRTVRNAKTVLQRARLMVAQQKNAYDLRQCISELDSCMQDDFVCGSNYTNCLDPTGKYIVNGSIIVGSTPGVPGGGLESGATTASGLYTVWNYGNNLNAWGTGGSVSGYVSDKIIDNIKDFSNDSDGSMARFLQNKIGWLSDEGKNMGMCMSVLNKCQDSTYTAGRSSTKKYAPDNPVIKNYLERVAVQIKSAQDTLLADYAEDCISDVSSCLSQNGYDENNPSSTKSRIAISACASVIRTCKSVNGDCTVCESVNNNCPEIGTVVCNNSDDAAWIQAIIVGYPDEVGGYTNSSACQAAGCLWGGTSVGCTDEPTTAALCTSVGGSWNSTDNECTSVQTVYMYNANIGRCTTTAADEEIVEVEDDTEVELDVE